MIAKIYSRVSERRLREHVEPDMEEELAGFRTGRQTQDHIFSIRTIIDKWLNRGKEVYLGFLDLHSAFDEVPREELWKALSKKKTPSKLMRAVQSIFQKVQGVVHMDGKTSGTFDMERGIKQGDSLSPLLFIVFMDEIMKT